jgi:hypothetical protein
MNVSFLDFWDGFDINNNFFIYLFRQIRDDIYVTNPNNADIIIFSCFGNTNRNYTHCKKIFYTGENIRPDFNNCNFSFTFDFDSYGEKNIRIPLWLIQFDFFNVKSYGNPEFLIPLEYIKDKQLNQFSNVNKENFCVIINNHLANKREDILKCLIKDKKQIVHGYGKIFNNRFDGEYNKLKLLSKFKFNICFENVIHSGYYTEKLIHAKMSNCLPLYYADSNCNLDFNKNSYLNLTDYESVDHLCEHILDLNNDDYKYNQILNEPLFSDDNYPINLYNSILSQINKIIV